MDLTKALVFHLFLFVMQHPKATDSLWMLTKKFSTLGLKTKYGNFMEPRIRNQTASNLDNIIWLKSWTSPKSTPPFPFSLHMESQLKCVMKYLPSSFVLSPTKDLLPIY